MNRTSAGKRQRAFVLCVALVGAAAVGAAVDRLAFAQQPGIKRTILLRTDEPGSQTHEAVMGIAEIAPGAMAGKHRHPGIEIGYILEGSVTLKLIGLIPLLDHSATIFDWATPPSPSDATQVVEWYQTVHVEHGGVCPAGTSLTKSGPARGFCQ